MGRPAGRSFFLPSCAHVRERPRNAPRTAGQEKTRRGRADALAGVLVRPAVRPCPFVSVRFRPWVRSPMYLRALPSVRVSVRLPVCGRLRPSVSAPAELRTDGRACPFVRAHICGRIRPRSSAPCPSACPRPASAPASCPCADALVRTRMRTRTLYACIMR